MNELIPKSNLIAIEQTISFCKSISNIKVEDNTSLENANELRKQVRIRHGDIDNDRRQLVTPLNQRIDEINDVYRDPLTALKNLETNLRQAIGDYQTKLQNEAREAEEKRRAEEQKRKALEEQRRKEAEKSGVVEPVQEIEKTESPPVVIPVVPKIDGMQMRTYWKGIVQNKKEFVKWCIKNNNLHMLDVNQKELDKLATATKGSIEIAGIEFQSEQKPAFRK